MTQSPFDSVAQARTALFDARELLIAAVLVAKEGGCTWASIGRVLGISRQAAFERFASRVTGDANGRRPDAGLDAVAALNAIRAADLGVGAAERGQRVSVEAARSAGLSWVRIGEALGGISRQAARQRFGRGPVSS